MTTKTILHFPRTENHLFIKTRFHLPKSYLESGWNIQFASADIDAEEARHFIDFWKPDGCYVNNDHLPASIFADIPTVFSHRNRSEISPNSSLLSYDEKALAQLAARELLRFHCASYAYIPEGKQEYWDMRREREFVCAMRTNRQAVHTFPNPQPDMRSREYCAALAEWLSALPQPIGIFAACDAVAEIVLGACYHAKIKCPDDALVICVSCEDTICESTHPTLSSIVADERAFFKSTIELLDRQMRRRHAAAREIFIPPSGVIHRASTRLLAKSDPQVLSALDMIRLKGGEGLRARDVLATFPCSRRMAELRFRAATGHSVLEEILAVRQERIRQLRASGIKDEAVAQMCGYANRSSLHRLLQE